MSLNVLVTAGSRHVPLVQAFQRAVRTSGGGSVIVTDINPLSPTVYVADRSLAFARAMRFAGAVNIQCRSSVFIAGSSVGFSAPANGSISEVA